MPISWLISYWEQAASLTLPYIKNRKVALEEKFSNQIIFRRHDQNGQWIYVKSKKDILANAFRHTYSFHPHQLSDDGVLWFVMDLDKRNTKMPFRLVAIAAKYLAAILSQEKQDFNLKFSGNRGFHFYWSIAKLKKSDLANTKIYNHEHELIEKYAQQLETIIQDSKEKLLFNKYFSTDKKVFNTNSADKKNNAPILLDKNILKPLGLIRSPWSIHPLSELASAPITVDDLVSFKKKNYTVDKVIERLK